MTYKEKLMSGALMLPPGQALQTLVSFNAAAIENGFILTKTYVIQESGRTMQTQRSHFYPTLGDVVKSLQDDVAN